MTSAPARAVPRAVLPPVEPPQVVDLRPAPREAPAPAVPQLRARVTETPPGADGRPRAPRREVELGVPGYQNFRCWIWSNYPQAVRLELTSGDETRTLLALARLVVEHNGWCDQEGAPYPDAQDPAFWEAIPTELAQLLARLILLDAPAAFPTSASANGAR